MSKLKVFIIECPNPNDLLQRREEARSLESICDLFGYELYTFKIKSKNELIEVFKYISTINSNDDHTLCIHISAHGNNDGLRFGYEHLTWDTLAGIFSWACKKDINYKGKRVFIISSCMSKYQQLTSVFKVMFTGGDIVPPKYIFVSGDESIKWEDAVVLWTILYHELPKVELDEKKKVQDILDRIKGASLGNLYYYRWDDTQNIYRMYKARGSNKTDVIRKMSRRKK